MIWIFLLMVTATPRSAKILKHQEKFEKEILDSWADGYVKAFFRPVSQAPHPFRLDQLYVQRDETNTDRLYRNATKYNFKNEVLLTTSNLQEVFQTEQKILKKSGISGDVSKESIVHPRHSASPHHKSVSSYLTIKLGRLGLYTVNQQFQFNNVLKDSKETETGGKRCPVLDKKVLSGLNVFGVLPGERWGSAEDMIMVLSAHWDTVPSSPGTNDNGSGVVALLEIARILSGSKPKNSIIFAFFDKEEVGCEGSKAFVRQFVVPLIVGEFGGTLQGVYNLDTILSFTSQPHTQELDPSWEKIDKNLVKRMKKNDLRGDFIMTVGRNTSEDLLLATTFAKHLEGYTVHHLKVGDFSHRQPDRRVLADNLFAVRSDQVRFWYYQEQQGSEGVLSQFSFPGLLVTDTANLRGYMKQCYHAQCDTFNNNNINKDNMHFLAGVTTALAKALMELCYEEKQQPIMQPDNRLDAPEVVEERKEPVVDNDDDADVNNDIHVNEGRRQFQYENVQTQINIENLHLTLSDPGTGPRGNERKFLYLDPALDRVKNIINNFYNEDAKDNFNSPMVIQLRNAP